MTFTPFRAVCAGLALLALTPSASLAQSDFVIDPQNLPPDSFTGDTFVDNAGCIFVRAGFNGDTTWVPRVSRAREPICGQQPTFPASTVAEAPAPTPSEPERTVPVQTAQAEAPPPPAPEPRPTTSAAASPTPAAQPRAATPPRMVTPAPRRTATMAPAPRIVSAPLIGPSVVPVAHSGTVAEAPRAALNAAPRASSESWIVPRHVYENRSVARPVVPAGFRPAWEDDRLNPWRAWQKVDGYVATQQFWTNTVPRQGVTAATPPDDVRQPEIAYRGTGPAPREQLVLRSSGTLRSNFGGPAVFVSTRSEPAPVADTPRFVHVGAFSSAAGAEEAAARLQRAGLSVRFGTHHRDGTALRSVLVGPFSSDRGMQLALAQVRAAGYGGAAAR